MRHQTASQSFAVCIKGGQLDEAHFRGQIKQELCRASSHTYGGDADHCLRENILRFL